jgi:predicted RNA-binding protein associated with RNAse of E/G family
VADPGRRLLGEILETSQYFKPGDVVVYRGVLHGRVMWACPAIVVDDRPDLTALYWRAGTPVMRHNERPTVESLLENQFEVVPAQWVKTDVLSLTLPGEAFSVEMMWQAGTTELDCWYVHLQEPMRRSAVGFETMDQLLDIVISPDRSNWRWKDEDELEEAVAIGLFTPGKADAIWAEGERVIERLHHNRPPFCDGWEHWRPAAEWEIPEMPADWDRVD